MSATPIEERPPLTDVAIRGFIGDDAAETLDDALDGLLNGAPVFTYMGDLRIEGDIKSSQLLAGRPGFQPPVGDGRPPDTTYSIFVRGNLEVAGVLSIDQYHDVYVRGDLRAKSILSHTGNLIAAGRIDVDDVIAFECNEEGGLLHGASCHVPLLCHFGGGDWAVTNTGTTVHGEDYQDPEFVALLKALETLGVEAMAHKAFSGVRSLVAGGRVGALLDALAVKRS